MHSITPYRMGAVIVAGLVALSLLAWLMYGPQDTSGNLMPESGPSEALSGQAEALSQQLSGDLREQIAPGCADAKLKIDHLDLRDTPDDQADQGLVGTYLQAAVSLSRADAVTSFTAQGEARGSGSDAAAYSALLSDANERLIDLAPDCF